MPITPLLKRLKDIIFKNYKTKHARKTTTNKPNVTLKKDKYKHMKKSLFIFIAFNFLIINCNSQPKLNEKFNLMPWPQNITENNSKFLIDSSLTVSIIGKDSGRVHNAATRFLRRLSNRTGVFINEGFPIKTKNGTIAITFDRVSKLTIESDETYSLHIEDDIIKIKAKTDVGALRGLETLLQLTANDDHKYYFSGVTIKDSPRFVWRGLMIDVARHFQPVDVLKRNLRAMASLKMNVFHWHLSDDQGFRVESKVYPKLHELASDKLYYTQSQIKDVVKYASNLGIRVVPEFDVPGHATAILTAYPKLGSKKNHTYSIERNAGVFDPTLDPTNENTYKFLENLFTEMAELFPDDYFHIGGDENEGKHWDQNTDIQIFMADHNLKTNHDLQTYFNIKLEKILNKLGKKLMGWDEIMTPNMPKTAIIHSWRGENEGMAKGGSLIDAAKAGYKTILSNGFYIDRMLSVEHHYSVEPIGSVELTKEQQSNILGGEATMWGELVTPLTIDSRIWPRTAAIAERFWSPEGIKDIDNMLHRLTDVNRKLEELGITHIKNRDVILRSINNHEDNVVLKTLSKLCEPLKMYTRNTGGTKYKSFSPFSLFADACVADAELAVPFNKNVETLFTKNFKGAIKSIKKDLEKWSKIHDSFSTLNKNPNTLLLEPLSKNLSEASKLLFTALSTKKISQNELKKLRIILNILEKPTLDTELAIVTSLKKLSKYCETNYLINN